MGLQRDIAPCSNVGRDGRRGHRHAHLGPSAPPLQNCQTGGARGFGGVRFIVRRFFPIFHNFRTHVSRSPLDVHARTCEGMITMTSGPPPSYQHRRIGKACRGRCMPSTITPSSRPRTPWPAADAPIRARRYAPVSMPAPLTACYPCPPAAPRWRQRDCYRLVYPRIMSTDLDVLCCKVFERVDPEH